MKEKNVEKEKECWERKKVLSHIWVKSESDLNQISTRSLTSSNQSWYAHNVILLFKNSCLHECSFFAHFCW